VKQRQEETKPKRNETIIQKVGQFLKINMGFIGITSSRNKY